MEKRQPRKLAVILHADVVGSTTLVQRNESLAHARIQDVFQRFSKTIETYGGVAHEIRGDALVAEFDRASDAMSAALAFQIENTESNARLEDDLQPRLRIGISLGEVVIADNTVTGAGVVLAQRVEQLAEPGGVCITGAIHEAAPQHLPLDYSDLGKREAKGFDEPVQVYSASVKAGEQVPPPEPAVSVVAQSRALKPLWSASAIALLILVIGALAWWQPWVQRVEPASVERMAFPLPDKPSIAVLPFTNMSGDPEQEYFVDGMSDDLITDLSKISGLFVIARNSSFSYKGQQVKVRQVAEELGVRYVLEGSVRRAGDQVRINAQLIDATTGGHLWAERYDGSLADVFALQDRVTTQIVDAMSVTLTPQELENLGSLGTPNAAAHDAYLQGLSFYLRDTPADNAKAEAHFKRAVELDPDFKRAYTALAKVYYKGADPEWAKAMSVYWRNAIFLAHENLAKSAGANIADAHVVRSWMALIKHQVGVALREAERALDLSPNDVDALKAYARALIYAGQYAEGRKLANRVIRLDPAVPAEPLYLIGLSHFGSGSYEDAAEYGERSLEHDPSTSEYAGPLAAAYGKLGMEKEAKEAWLRYLNTWLLTPWIAAAVYYYPFQDGEVLKHLADGFEAAGADERGRSRYLKLDPETKLAGQEIKSLLFGHTIRGEEYWSSRRWAQVRTIDGKVSHSGDPIHTGSHDAKEGESWIEDDRLCERWPEVGDEITICVLIFRDSAGGQNDYYMVTDQGPQRFSVSD